MTELHTPDITGKDRELRLDYLAALHYPAADGCPQLEKAEEKPTSFAVPWTDGPGPGGNRLHSYCLIGEWSSANALVGARSAMIATLDTFRHTLEDQGNGLGFTDAVSGDVVLDLAG